MSTEIRQSLLGQMAHFADELRALRTQVHLIPDEILTGRPLERDLSIKEIYSLLVAYDEFVYEPAAKAVLMREESSPAQPDDSVLLERSGLLELDIDAILRRGEAARVRLLVILDSLTDWSRSVGGEAMDIRRLAYSIIQHDTMLLREAATRLYDAGRIGKH
ncbi:MAG: hypothetical protein WD275_04255 [Rhodothermales bacterium]